jgi:chromosome segregation ATPase
MDQSSTAQSEALTFTPKRNPHTTVDEGGQAIVSMLRAAAAASQENVDRAMDMAHKLAVQLRAAEERIAQLESEGERLESRAARAEQWLETIKQEIEEKLIAPMEASRPELPAGHTAPPKIR